MSTLRTESIRRLLHTFQFQTLFIEEIGWSYPTYEEVFSIHTSHQLWNVQKIAELTGVAVFLVHGLPDKAERLRIEAQLTERTYEHLVIFVDHPDHPTKSLWLWVQREGQRTSPREHLYVKGQPGDLLIAKLASLIVHIDELDQDGHFPLVAVLDRMETSFNVEQVTKQFFQGYKEEHLHFSDAMEGIPDEKNRRWYASVLLHRLMFIWFLQRKGFLDQGDTQYLVHRLEKSQDEGEDTFYPVFLCALFFEGFAKPAKARSSEVNLLLGKIPYLNGGLFLPHRIEQEYSDSIRIPDGVFEKLFRLFSKYSWHLDDTPGGQDNEINPDVLGYLFEKYINEQKSFGAYYTKPEITEYLSERTIHRVVLDKVRECGFGSCETIADVVEKLDRPLCDALWNRILPKISVLDPACGSGAFLVAAMKVLVDLYLAVVKQGKWEKEWEKEHKNIAYAIKRKVITENLFGVDIHEEAVEIARLRLFLSLVSSVKGGEECEPLPNIDFNLVSGNSLIGLLDIDGKGFESQQGDMYGGKPYYQVVKEKNEKVRVYRETVGYGQGIDLSALREEIEGYKSTAQEVLNKILLREWGKLKIQYEEATWDKVKGKEGKAKKRLLTEEDIQALTPFHWGFEFDEILHERGGFDVILMNPPWEVFQTDEKEFFQKYDNSIKKNALRIEEWKEYFNKFMEIAEIRAAWLKYCSGFSYVSKWYKEGSQFSYQGSGKVNLYKVFLERSYHLLRKGGIGGVVVPSGIYTDWGAKGLRKMLFEKTEVMGLFGFENRKEIFEGVTKQFKFVIMDFKKGGKTYHFPAVFMRHDMSDLRKFPKEYGLNISVDMIRKLSPDLYSVMEFQSEKDISIVNKLLMFPLLGEKIEGKWNIVLKNEFNMTTDSPLFKTKPGEGRLPLYEGKMIYQFDANYAQPKYWLEEKEARASLLGRKSDSGQKLDYQSYRLGFRDVTGNSSKRTFIGTILPPNRFCPHTMSLEKVFIDTVENGFSNQNSTYLNNHERIFLLAMLNSFICDYLLRQQITLHVSFFFIYNLPIPRLVKTDPYFFPIIDRAARLVCVTSEFNVLAKEVGLNSYKEGVTDPLGRAQLRAELDAIVAHVYGLTEKEFEHILDTFPLVEKSVKQAALEEYRRQENHSTHSNIDKI